MDLNAIIFTEYVPYANNETCPKNTPEAILLKDETRNENSSSKPTIVDDDNEGSAKDRSEIIKVDEHSIFDRILEDENSPDTNLMRDEAF